MLYKVLLLKLSVFRVVTPLYCSLRNKMGTTFWIYFALDCNTQEENLEIGNLMKF